PARLHEVSVGRPRSPGRRRPAKALCAASLHSRQRKMATRTARASAPPSMTRITNRTMRPTTKVRTKATAKAVMRRVRATLLVPDMAIMAPAFHDDAFQVLAVGNRYSTARFVYNHDRGSASSLCTDEAQDLYWPERLASTSRLGRGFGGVFGDR